MGEAQDFYHRWERASRAANIEAGKVRDLTAERDRLAEENRKAEEFIGVMTRDRDACAEERDRLAAENQALKGLVAEFLDSDTGFEFRDRCFAALGGESAALPGSARRTFEPLDSVDRERARVLAYLAGFADVLFSEGDSRDAQFVAAIREGIEKGEHRRHPVTPG